MYRPFRIRVTRSTRISPHFQRVTFTGIDQMGPDGPIRDLRIKLIFPIDGRLPTLPFGDDGADEDSSGSDWYSSWLALDETERGVMRTYSVRDVRRSNNGDGSGVGGGYGGLAVDELDIDFVLHMDDPGPAAAWAASASEGDELILIAPNRNDDSGAGIEFRPGNAEIVRLFGDETALPAITKILSEWPEGVRGSAHIEVPCAADIQQLKVPDGVTVQWIARDDYGEVDSEVTTGKSHISSRSLLGSLQELMERDEDNNGAHSATGYESTKMNADAPSGESIDVNVCENDDELVWETPDYSASGDRLTPENTLQETPSSDSHVANTYFWIAGESGVVVKMRRYLVKEIGIPRKHVSFMGYWKRGKAAKG